MKIINKVLLLSICFILSSCNYEKNDFDILTIQNIAEWAILECEFNNVARFNKEKDKGLFGIFEKDKKAFAEYNISVKIGVNANDVKVNGKEIIIPKAIVFTDSIKDSDFKPVKSKDGIKKNNIPYLEERQAKKEANEVIVNWINNDNKLLIKAQNIVKNNIEQYLKKIKGGNNYIVKLAD